jgi:hypothetical protein
MLCNLRSKFNLEMILPHTIYFKKMQPNALLTKIFMIVKNSVTEVKKLKFEVNKLKKQAKVQPTQDNRSNVVKKLEKGKNRTKNCFSTFKEASSK